jgi:hypothetical protein
VSSAQLTTPTNSRHTAIDFDDEASGLLSQWLPIVGGTPQLIGAKEHEAAVRELVAWYERVFQLDGYCVGRPIQGLDALVDELVHVSVPPNDTLSSPMADGPFESRKNSCHGGGVFVTTAQGPLRPDQPPTASSGPS